MINGNLMKPRTLFVITILCVISISLLTLAAPPGTFDGKPATGRYQLFSTIEESENQQAILRQNAPKIAKEVTLYRLDTWSGITWKLYPSMMVADNLVKERWVQLDEQPVRKE